MQFLYISSVLHYAADMGRMRPSACRQKKGTRKPGLVMVEPPRITVLLFVTHVNALVARALAYGHSLTASRFEAVTIATDDAALRTLQRDWAALSTDVPLVVVHSADGEFLRPALRYVRSLVPSRDHSVLVLLLKLVVSHCTRRSSTTRR